MEKYGAPDLREQQEKELKGVQGQLSSLGDKLEKTASEKLKEDELRQRATQLEEELATK
jgi:hypothetical protein